MPLISNTPNHETEQNSRMAAGNLNLALSKLFQMFEQVERFTPNERNSFSHFRKSALTQLNKSIREYTKVFSDPDLEMLLDPRRYKNQPELESLLKALSKSLDNLGFHYVYRKKDLIYLTIIQLKQLQGLIQDIKYDQNTLDIWNSSKLIFESVNKLLRDGLIISRIFQLASAGNEHKNVSIGESQAGDSVYLEFDFPREMQIEIYKGNTKLSTIPAFKGVKWFHLEKSTKYFRIIETDFRTLRLIFLTDDR